jgi:hypothetical protein
VIDTGFAAGFADFPLIAFQFQKTATVAQSMIPVFYAVAMATGAVAPLAFGRLLGIKFADMMLSIGIALFSQRLPQFQGGLVIISLIGCLTILDDDRSLVSTERRRRAWCRT